MYTVVTESHHEKLYQLRNDRYVYGTKHYDYVQKSFKTGVPICNSDMAYRLYHAVLFTSKEQAERFLEKFSSDPKRRTDKKFTVVEYSGSLGSLVLRERNSKYGYYYSVC